MLAHREALHAELDEVLNGRPPTTADLPNLPYLEQVVNETMRCYPAAYVNTRQSINEDEVLALNSNDTGTLVHVVQLI